MRTVPIAVDEFAAEERGRGGIPCWWHHLTPEQQAKVLEAKERGRTSASIYRVVRHHWDVPVALTSIGRHFRGDCRCSR